MTHLAGVGLMVVILIVTILIAGIIFRPIWNAVMPEVFGFKRLTLKQSWNLLSVIMAIVIFSAIAILYLRKILEIPLN